MNRPKVTVETIRRLYVDEKKSPAVIAAALGISAETVRSKLRRAGIPRRTRSEAAIVSSASGSRKPLPVTKSELKAVLRCPSCSWRWKRVGNRIKEACPQCNAVVDARRRPNSRGSVAKLQQWVKENQPRIKAMTAARRAQDRAAVLRLVGNGKVECVRCGCDKPELLEINHKDGGGTQEKKRLGAGQVYRDILKLKRAIDDLELCCRVCNALHYLEMKYGPLPYQITFDRKGGQ